MNKVFPPSTDDPAELRRFNETLCRQLNELLTKFNAIEKGDIVTFGADDSGGAGFKVLRVPN
jgi:hypothetical protein